MARLLLVLFLLGMFVHPALADDTARVKKYEAKARQGSYQEQRNLAYTLATSGDAAVANPTLGCAWYKLILLSGAPDIHDGDIGNAQVYCRKLPAEQQAAATAQAKRLHKEIYGSR